MVTIGCRTSVRGGRLARLILFADHSPAVQRRAERILLDQGFAVETVSNGVAAIKKFSRLQPDLVFADVSMAGKDGYEVCDFLKTSADFHGVPVLLVASDLEPYDQGRGERVGADGMLKKPFTDHELIERRVKIQQSRGGARDSGHSRTRNRRGTPT